MPPVPSLRLIQVRLVQSGAIGCLSGAAFLSLAPSSAQAVDWNANGASDVWEEKFDVSSYSPQADGDGDGASDFEESRAGTDPRDSRSVFAITTTETEGEDLLLRWRGEAGKSYRVVSRVTLVSGTWTEVAGFRVSAGGDEEFRIAGGAIGGKFFRVEVRDVDSDGDGISDWEERQLPGFDPAAPRSVREDVDDLAVLAGMLAGSALTVSVEAPVAVATEKEGADGVFRLTRSGGLGAVSVPFVLGGDPDPQRGSASAADFVLRDTAGHPITSPVTIPFGVPSVELRVTPVADDRIETRETVTLTLAPDGGFTVGGAGSASVAVVDAANTETNERIFVAYLVPAGGSTATGLSTLRLQGDNTLALVGLSFSGLSSPQTTSFLELQNGGSGVYVKGLPSGQVTESAWNVKAAGYLATDQAMLDALLAGEMGVVVNSTGFLQGEIRGAYRQSSGSSEPPEPGPPPASESLTGADLRRDVARFLTQATFGPKETEIAALTEQVETAHGGDRLAAYAAWIDEQLAMEPTRHEAHARAADAQEWALRGTDPVNYTTTTGEPGNSNRRRAWWTIVAGARDQLRQRVGFALSEIFVISDKNSVVLDRHYGAAHYYDQLVAASSGNFRTLLETISKSPMMGVYLSHLKNQKAVFDPVTGALLVSPDENFAREIMQLFSIGLVRLHMDGSLRLDAAGAPLPTYTNADIMELARVFTGWSFSRRHGSKAAGYPEEDNTNFQQNNGARYFQASWIAPMKNFPAYHDSGAKTVLGTSIPAGLDGEADLDAALDILCAHENVPPFLCRLLIQRLVTSTPSAGYIHRVAGVFADDGTGVRGNLGAVVKAILLDPEARNLAVTATIGFGKQKEPIIRYIQLLRAFGAASSLPVADLAAYGYSELARFAPGATRLRYAGTDGNLGQSPLSSPTVFNYFLPSYSPGGAIAQAGLSAPEMQLTNETQVIQAVNMNRTILNTSGQSVSALFSADATLDDVRIDRTPWEAFYNERIAAGDSVTQAVTALVDRLDDLLMAGRFRAVYASAPLPNPRASVIEAGTQVTSVSDRVINIFYLMANCPEFLHQK